MQIIFIWNFIKRYTNVFCNISTILINDEKTTKKKYERIILKLNFDRWKIISTFRNNAKSSKVESPRNMYHIHVNESYRDVVVTS